MKCRLTEIAANDYFNDDFCFGSIRDRGEPAVSPINVRSIAESGSNFRGATLTAARLVEPALDEFYATLSSEQKARFNTLQQVASP
ncbi:Spy/CpxP family protein refolding chaperone [Bradyrhizobium liaoningense]